MSNSDEIIVCFTSWSKRISFCKHIFETMLKQTLLPDFIYLTLSTDEFPNKEKDLPLELVNFVRENNKKCKIKWTKENNTVWKKFMYVMDDKPNAVILPVDDDIEYPNNYIEIMYKEYTNYDKQCPIVCFKNILYDGTSEKAYRHSGPFSLISKKFFKDTLNTWYDEIIKPSINSRWASDEVYTYIIWFNGFRYKFCDKIDAKKIYADSEKNSVEPYSKHYTGDYYKQLRENKDKLEEYIYKKYGKTLNDFFDAPIYVNITTYPLRDKYLPIMLENLKKQTKKPDKVILWLCDEEYNRKNIPAHIKQCLDNGVLTEIRWTEKNIYCHKRHEIFKTDNNVYNLFMDDDLLYENNYIETIYDSAKKHGICITTMASAERDFIGGKQLSNPIKNGQSIKNTLMGGLLCVPPYTYPLESFKYISIRDEYSKKCDETWLQCWCIITNTKVNAIKNRSEYKLCTIGDSQKTALWNENKQMETKNLIFKNVMFIKTAYKLDIIPLVKKIFPNFYIDGEIIKIIPDVLEKYKDYKYLFVKKEEKTSININNLPLVTGKIDGIDQGEYKLRKFNARKKSVVKKKVDSNQKLILTSSIYPQYD